MAERESLWKFLRRAVDEWRRPLSVGNKIDNTLFHLRAAWRVCRGS